MERKQGKPPPMGERAMKRVLFQRKGNFPVLGPARQTLLEEINSKKT